MVAGGRLPGDDRPADLDAGDDQRLGVVQRRHVSGGGGPVLAGGQLINSGTLDMSGLNYRFWTQYGGAISNLAGARLILPAGPGIILNGYQPATIYNYGWMGMCPGRAPCCARRRW